MNILHQSLLQIKAMLQRKQISCTELMALTLKQIAYLNPKFNAVVANQDDDMLMAQAKHCDNFLSLGKEVGLLHGIPMAIKDTAMSAGLVSTMGSPLLKDHIPTTDGLMVSRIRQAGAIFVGKTNVPEFGLGSHSFNSVYGVTGNAYNPNLSAGGSSGGAAVALALRMFSVLDGSDFMGSLRNPAGWNNVFGFRPSQGRVPYAHTPDIYLTLLPTEGPMARNIDDLALLLSIQAGYAEEVPFSLKDGGSQFRQKLSPELLSPKKIGWLGNLQGYLATEPGILEVCQQGLHRLEQIGCYVEESQIPFSYEKTWEAWLCWRKVIIAARLANYFSDDHKRLYLKPEAQWECQQALGLTANEFMRASEVRSDFYRSLLPLFKKYDFLALPCTQVWPFPINQRWPQIIQTTNGPRTMDTYHRWMEVTLYATFAGLPVISIPTGFSPEGLPMGLQILGPPQGDWQVLELSRAYQEVIPDWLNTLPQVLFN